MVAWYVLFIVLALVAVILNFKSKKISSFITKTDEPDSSIILKVKITALIIAAIDFILVLILL